MSQTIFHGLWRGYSCWETNGKDYQHHDYILFHWVVAFGRNIKCFSNDRETMCTFRCCIAECNVRARTHPRTQALTHAAAHPRTHVHTQQYTRGWATAAAARFCSSSSSSSSTSSKGRSSCRSRSTSNNINFSDSQHNFNRKYECSYSRILRFIRHQHCCSMIQQHIMNIRMHLHTHQSHNEHYLSIHPIHPKKLILWLWAQLLHPLSDFLFLF